MAAWCALHAADLTLGDDPPDDGPGWDVDGVVYPKNPRLYVPPGYDEMTTLWALYRGGGFAPGPLPDAGGSLQQACIMLDAFAVMTAASAEFQPERR